MRNPGRVSASTSFVILRKHVHPPYLGTRPESFAGNAGHEFKISDDEGWLKVEIGSVSLIRLLVLLLGEQIRRVVSIHESVSDPCFQLLLSLYVPLIDPSIT
jgi:hypothetical protein